MSARSWAYRGTSSVDISAPEIELERRDIPFVKYGGLEFLEAAHIKDVLAILRRADNSRYDRWVPALPAADGWQGTLARVRGLGVRLLRLTCRAADRADTAEKTPTRH